LKKLEALNNGKPFREARDDIEFGAKTLEYYAGWADKVCGKTIPADGPVFTYTKHEPIGVCGILLTWGYPVLMFTWKIGMAIATGNTLVIKPSEETPLTGLYLASLLKEAGFPSGVVNVINGHGHNVGAALALHNDVDKIGFTGTEEVGHKILEMSGRSNLKRVGLELGGKSPFIIFDLNDTDLRRAAGDAAFSMFTNQGQSCVASSSIFVHESVYEKFIQFSKEIAENLVVGDPFAAETTQGSLVNKENFDRVLEYIDSGKRQGARLVCGGSRVGQKGFFVKPTIFGNFHYYS
jgi:acyl-CoA reductase-like NAD-dependent aldehyde dehydrogenase